MVKGAWVTLATNDSYSLGALVLAHSLKQVGTQQELAILITPGVTNSMRERLSEVFNLVKEVNVLDSRDKENLKLLQRPELGITFTKLHCWQLTEYEKCVFLDADTLVLQNCDELFQREELSAAPDVGWPDCFNSGVFVYRPSMETYNNLIQFALDKGSFDGGDQGLLNLYFSDWAHKDITKHLPFIYNVCSTAFYSYLPAFKQYGKDMKIIHFIGNAKPWLQYFDTESRKVRPSRDVGHLEAILQMWWNIFCSMIHPNLSSDMISSYPSELVMARSPDHFPQPSQETSAPIDCTNVSNFWDPWEEYDRNQLNVTIHSPEPLESHNTIALSPVADNHSPIGIVFEEPSLDHNNQPSIDSSKYFEHPPNDQSCIQALIIPSPEENVLNENISSFFEHTNTTDFKKDNNPPVEYSNPLHTQENSAIPASSVNSSPENLPPPPPEIPPEKKQITSEETPPPQSYIPSCKYESEDAIDKEKVEVENNITESGLAGAFARLTLGQQRSPEQEALENCLRRQNWEQGNIDYLGRDSFDNIWSKICETLSKTPQEDEDNSTQIRTEDSTLVSPQPKSDPVLKEVISQQVLSSDDSTSCEIVQEKASTISTPSAKPEDACSDSTKTVPTQETTTDPQLPTQSPEDNLSVEKVSSQSLETAKEVTTVVQETIPSSELTPSQQTQMESKAEDMPDSVQVPVEEKSRPVLLETKQSECLTQDVPLEEKSSTAPTQQVLPQPESVPKLTEADQSKSSISTENSLKETLPKTTAPIQTADRSIDDEASQCKLPQKPLEKENSQAERSQIESHKPQSHPETSPDNILPKPAEQICSLGKSPSKVSSETEPKQSPISTEGQICSLEETSKTSVPKEPSKQQSPSTVSEPKDNLEKASTIAKTSAVTEPTELKQGSPTSAVQTCSLDKSGSVEKTSIQTQATPDIKTSQPSDSHKKSTQFASVVPQTPPAPTPMVSSVESPPPITPPPRKNGGKKNQTKSKK